MSPRNLEQNTQMRAEALAKISCAALEVFAEYGYHGATIKQIAQKAELSHGLVYHYFPSKEAVFRHLVDLALESTIAGMQAIMGAPGGAWERLEAFAGMLVQSAFTGESARYFLVMLQAMTQGRSIPGLQAHIEQRSEAYFQTLAPVIAEAQGEGLAKAGDPRLLAAAFLAFLQGLSLFGFHRRELGPQVTPELLTSVLRRTP